MFDKYWNSELEDCVAVLVLPYGMNDLWRVGIRHAIRTLAEVAKKYALRMYIRKVRESNMVSIDPRDVNGEIIIAVDVRNLEISASKYPIAVAVSISPTNSTISHVALFFISEAKGVFT